MTLLEYLNKDQAHTRMWRAVVAFGDSRKSLEELLQQFEFIMKRFPETKHFERAKETATMLKRLIQEDKDHSEKNVPALDKLKGDQRVAELIHQLCTQNGHQWSQPGACDIFSDQRGEKSPAHLLVAEGFDAVPQLIEALDDDRFTRSVGYHRNFYFSHHVLRVADCSERILSRIAGRGFYQRKHTNGAMAKDGESDTTKGRIEAWWSDVQSKGEKQVLIDAVKLGDSNSGRQAKALVEKYPDEAVEAIRIGLAKAEGWQQQTMIGWLSKLKDDSATELLKDQLTNASTLGGRIAAARQLVPRDGSKKLALDAMVKEWLNYKSADAESALYLNRKIELAQFLLTSESTEGIQAVAKTFETLDTNAQCSALNALVDLATVSDESHEALEKFLVECLLITGEQ